MANTITIRDLTSGDTHTLPADTRCRDRHGLTVTLASLEVGETADVESDDPDDRDGHDGECIWWPSERIA